MFGNPRGDATRTASRFSVRRLVATTAVVAVAGATFTYTAEPAWAAAMVINSAQSCTDAGGVTFDVSLCTFGDFTLAFGDTLDVPELPVDRVSFEGRTVINGVFSSATRTNVAETSSVLNTGTINQVLEILRIKTTDMVNRGTINVLGGASMETFENGTFTNDTGGVIDVKSGILQLLDTPGTVVNRGSITIRSGSSFVVSSGITFANTGTVTAECGAIISVLGTITGNPIVVPPDCTRPAVTVEQPSGIRDPTWRGNAAFFDIVFTEPVTGFDLNDIVISGPAAVGGRPELTFNDPTGPDFYLRIFGLKEPGILTVTVPAGVATDAAGNPNTASRNIDNEMTFFVDTTPPTVEPRVSGFLGANDWYVTAVNLGWDLSEPESEPTFTGCGSSILFTDTAGLTVTCSASSEGGTTTRSVTVKRDSTRPTIALSSRTPAANAGGWNNTPVELVWSCSDEMSGPVEPTVSTTLTGEGASQVASGQCFDNAGNRSFPDSEGPVNIDLTTPTITLSSRTGSNAAGWNTSPVTVQWSCADQLSGVTALTVTRTVSTEGANQSVTGTCTDRAGNDGSDTQSGINIDATAPTITRTGRTTANSAGWNTTPVEVTWACADEVSGAVNAVVTATVSTEGRDQSVTGTCTDNAGNTVSDTVLGINVDTTAPTITRTGRTAANAAGWNATPVEVTWACSDALSGAVSAVVTRTVSTDGLNQSATGTCTDNAGNTVSDTVSGINVDQTRPTLNPAASATTVPLNGSVTVNPNAADATSGVASSSCGSVDTSTAGVKTVTCTATDRAGNSNTATVQVTVGGFVFSGFFGGVANPPSVNTVEAGSTVTLRFSLGGDRGLRIFATGFPRSQQVNCSTGALIGSAQSTVTARGTSLTYDRTTSRYLYPWSTDRRWGGTCRRLTITFVDGTTVTANFRFKRD